MSLTTDPKPAPQPAPQADPPAPKPELQCERCRAPLAEDQEWCLECGTARTLIHRPPDWRIPLAVIGTVVALVLAAFAIALINLSSEANRSAATVTQVARATTAAPAKPPAPARPARIPRWPIGLPGWTVELASSPSRATARARALQIAGAGIRVGVLNSSRHPSMAPGRWIVFAGRYPTKAAAQARADRLVARGYSTATPALVGRGGA